MILALNLIFTVILGDMYCPTQGDFDAGGNIQWEGNGWKMTGSGGVHGKTSFNLLGGYVQFDIDTSGAQGGINNNFYTSSPWPGLFPSYCDIQANDSPECMEMDIVENNGDCISQVTWHTWPNHNGDCDQGGCWGQAYASGKRTMRASFSSDGWMTTTINGGEVPVTNPTPSQNAKDYVAQQTAAIGLQFHSTQWQGWVPGDNKCPGGGNLGASTFSVTNVVVSGTIVQGQTPTKCRDLPAEYLKRTLDSLYKVEKYSNGTISDSAQGIFD